MSQNSTPPNVEYEAFIAQQQIPQQAQQLEQALQKLQNNTKIPNNASITYTSTPTLKTKKRKSTSQEVTSALSNRFKNNAWWKNNNNTPKKGKRLTFAPGTKNVSTNNANTPPLDGGRRRIRRTHRKRKHRRTCRR